MELLKRAIAEGTNYSELVQQVKVAQTPSEQQQGLRGAPQGTSMVFPQSKGNFNTKGMDYSINIDKFDNKGDLVQSYRNVPPGIDNLPMGPKTGTVIETPAENQDIAFAKTGGPVKKFQTEGVIEGDKESSVEGLTFNYPEEETTELWQPNEYYKKRFGKDFKSTLFFGKHLMQMNNWIKSNDKENLLYNKDAIQDELNWIRNYIQSPKYLERLGKEFPDYTQDQLTEEMNARLNNINNVNITFEDQLAGGKALGVYWPTEDKGKRLNNANVHDPSSWVDREINEEKAGTIGLQTGYHQTPGDESVGLHEIDHQVNDGGMRIPASTEKLIHDNTTPMGQGGYQSPEGLQFGYVNTPTEYIARQTAIRKLLHDEGIYDSNTEDFTIDHYNKMLENGRLVNNKQLHDLIGDPLGRSGMWDEEVGDFIPMGTIKGSGENWEEERRNSFIEMMNNIAMDQDTDESFNYANQAKTGGPIKYQTEGTVKKDYNIDNILNVLQNKNFKENINTSFNHSSISDGLPHDNVGTGSTRLINYEQDVNHLTTTLEQQKKARAEQIRLREKQKQMYMSTGMSEQEAEKLLSNQASQYQQQQNVNHSQAEFRAPQYPPPVVQKYTPTFMPPALAIGSPGRQNQSNRFYTYHGLQDNLNYSLDHGLFNSEAEWADHMRDSYEGFENTVQMLNPLAGGEMLLEGIANQDPTQTSLAALSFMIPGNFEGSAIKRLYKGTKNKANNLTANFSNMLGLPSNKRLGNTNLFIERPGGINNFLVNNIERYTKKADYPFTVANINNSKILEGSKHFPRNRHQFMNFDAKVNVPSGNRMGMNLSKHFGPDGNPYYSMGISNFYGNQRLAGQTMSELNKFIPQYGVIKQYPMGSLSTDSWGLNLGRLNKPNKWGNVTQPNDWVTFNRMGNMSLPSHLRHDLPHNLGLQAFTKGQAEFYKDQLTGSMLNRPNVVKSFGGEQNIQSFLPRLRTYGQNKAEINLLNRANQSLRHMGPGQEGLPSLYRIELPNVGIQKLTKQLGGPLQFRTGGAKRKARKTRWDEDLRQNVQNTENLPLVKPAAASSDSEKRNYWLNLYSNKNFIQRILMPDKDRGREYMHPSTGLKMSHNLYREGNVIFPLVVEDAYGILGKGPGQLHYFIDENGQPDVEKAKQYAAATKEYMQTDSEEEAVWFVENYQSGEYKRATGNRKLLTGGLLKGYKSEQPILKYQTEGVVEEEDSYTHDYSDTFFNFLQQQENNITDRDKDYYNWGYYTRKADKNKGITEKRFYPHTSVEGGAKTIGFGHKIKSGEDFSKGLTWAEAEELLRNDISAQQQRMENRYGTKSDGPYNWFKNLSQNEYDLLLNYEFQVRNSSVGHVDWETLDRDKTKPNKTQGGSGTYPNLIKAIVDGNYENILKEYKIKGLDTRNQALLTNFIEPLKNTFHYRDDKRITQSQWDMAMQAKDNEDSWFSQFYTLENLSDWHDKQEDKKIEKKKKGGILDNINYEQKIEKYLSQGNTKLAEKAAKLKYEKENFDTGGFISVTDHVPNLTKWRSLRNQNDSVHPLVVTALQELEMIYPEAFDGVQISSAHRDANWNEEIGGQPHSRHLSGFGLDLVGDGWKNLSNVLNNSQDPNIIAWKNKWTSDKHQNLGRGVIDEGNHLHLNFVTPSGYSNDINTNPPSPYSTSYGIPSYMNLDTQTKDEDEYENILDGYISSTNVLSSSMLRSQPNRESNTEPIIKPRGHSKSPFQFSTYNSLTENYSWNDPQFLMALGNKYDQEKALKEKIAQETLEKNKE